MPHTPGPWEAMIEHNPHRYQIEIGSPEWCPLASAWDTNEESVANAHLIAAAPELLEACKMLVEYWMTGAAVDGESESADRVRAAIRKATGGK